MSTRSRAILKAITEGDSFEQILLKNSTVTYHDIFRAAAEFSAFKCGQPRERANMSVGTIFDGKPFAQNDGNG